MKSSGVVRKLDVLGRVTIPMEFRRVLRIEEGTSLEMSREGGSIVLRKREEKCVFCDCSTGLTEFKGKKICAKCRKELGIL